MKSDYSTPFQLVVELIDISHSKCGSELQNKMLKPSVTIMKSQSLTIWKLQRSNTPERKWSKRSIDSLKVTGTNRVLGCLRYQPLGMSFTEFLKLLPQNRFAKDLTQNSVQPLLIALEFLHEYSVVHKATPLASQGTKLVSMTRG